MTRILFISLLVACLPHLAFSQVEDSSKIVRTQELNEMAVSLVCIVYRLKPDPNSLNTEQIKLLGVNDVGEMVSKLSGANIKSYGGLGGLKTVSFRSIGSGHTSTVIDGFVQGNQQTGAVNLGAIPSDNIVVVTQLTSGSYGLVGPVSSFISGSSLLMQTFENTLQFDSLMIRANVNYGSFDQKNGYLAFKINRPKYFVSTFGKYRNAVGNYNYRIQNGNSELTGTRKNNDYEDYYFGSTMGFRFQKLSGRIGYKGMGIDQGLPGAVVFYANQDDERLETKGHRIFADLEGRFDKNYFRVYTSANRDEIRYQDPTYLNNSGGIDITYTNQDVRSGVVFNHYFNQLALYGGIEHCLAVLMANDTSFAEPLRNHLFGVVGVNGKYGSFRFSASLSSQLVDETNRNGESAINQKRINPFAKMEWEMKRFHLTHLVWYRNSIRIPTFNELYYNNIGNSQLLPEIANQVNYGISYWAYPRAIEISASSNAFVNTVMNKIVAIPSKNLFIWSMQNVENALIYGADAQVNFSYTFRKIKLELLSNYTYQKVIDRTDGSLNYGSQLAYSPEHLANFDVTVRRNKMGFTVSNSFTSMRYSLNENIAANEVKGFYLLDLGAYRTFSLPKKQEMRVQLNVKNVLNESYAYIRSFVMPGINYQISVNYAFH